MSSHGCRDGATPSCVAAARLGPVRPAGVSGRLLNWRRNRDGQWYAYVIYATGGGNMDVTVTTQWVPADHVWPTHD
jgi:hypothetical protein